MGATKPLLHVNGTFKLTLCLVSCTTILYILYVESHNGSLNATVFLLDASLSMHGVCLVNQMSIEHGVLKLV